MTLTMLQDYWWMLISVLGAILVFMLLCREGRHSYCVPATEPPTKVK